jgi:hypothetical protein
MQPIQKKNKISSVDNVNNRIVLSEEYFNKIKNTIKITGSLFSEIMLENNNYSKTNFQI